jgi:hypothetical protein
MLLFFYSTDSNVHFDDLSEDNESQDDAQSQSQDDAQNQSQDDTQSQSQDDAQSQSQDDAQSSQVEDDEVETAFSQGGDATESLAR